MTDVLRVLVGVFTVFVLSGVVLTAVVPPAAAQACPNGYLRCGSYCCPR
jgi:hypothetical protein